MSSSPTQDPCSTKSNWGTKNLCNWWSPPKIVCHHWQVVDSSSSDKSNSSIVSWPCEKWLIFCIFCWWQQKISHNLGKMFKSIWRILFGCLWKCYGLFDSELTLARGLTLRIQGLGFNQLFSERTQQDL